MISRPNGSILHRPVVARRAIIMRSYLKALENGDKNVYFIDGPTLVQYAKNDCSVDGTHPNDLGFYSMATVLLEQLKKIL